MHIYYLPITSDFTPADTALIPFVSDRRQAQIARYPQDKSKKLSLYAALLAQMILSQMTGIAVSQLRFSVTQNKKPVFLNDTSILFNLSHTDGGILCGFSLISPVGVDIEAIRKPHPGVIRKTFHPAEQNYWNTQNTDIAFVEIWTRKEAYTKMLGTGIACELTKINTLSDELSADLKTWREDSFICSACGDLSEFQKTEITAMDIRQFYSSLQ